jgi:hypothetical protein
MISVWQPLFFFLKSSKMHRVTQSLVGEVWLVRFGVSYTNAREKGSGMPF